MTANRNLKRLVSLVLVFSFVLSLYTVSYAAEGYETDFETVTVTDGKIMDGSTERFADVSLEGDSTNKYIKGTNSGAFFFRARSVFYTGTGVLEFDANLGSSENFIVLVAGGSKNHTILTFDRTNGLKDTNVQVKAPSLIPAGWHNIKIMFDFDSPRKYSVIFDGELVVSSADLTTAPGTKGIKITTTSGIDNLKYYESTLPLVYDVEFKSQPKIGSVVFGDAKVHSPYEVSAETYSLAYSYYVSDTEQGTYLPISQTEDLYVTSNGGLAIFDAGFEGKYLKVGAKAVSASEESIEAFSGPIQVAPCDKCLLTEGTSEKDVCFRLTSSLTGNVSWTLSPEGADGVNLTSDGLLTVTSVPALDVYAVASNENGEKIMTKLDFVNNSQNGLPIGFQVYPLVFDTVVDTSSVSEITAGNLVFNLGSFPAVSQNSEVNFKLVFEDNKYYAFADGVFLQSGDSTSAPLQITADASFVSYYAGSPLLCDGAFIKAQIPSVICEGTDAAAVYEFYNENGVYPESGSYLVEWYVDGIKDSEGDTFTVPFGRTGANVYAVISAGTKQIQTNTAVIDSQYSLTVVEDGKFTVDLNSADRDVYVLFKGDDKSVYCADLSGGAHTATLTPGQGYEMYFADKDDLSLSGMPVEIDGSIYRDKVTASPHINYLVRKDIGAQTNEAALFEIPYTADEVRTQKLPLGGDLSDIIRDIYISDSLSDTCSGTLSPDYGRFNLISVAPGGAKSETEIFKNKYKLFADANNFNYANFEAVLKDTLCVSSDAANELNTMLNGLNDKTKVVNLTGNSEDSFPAAVHLSFISELSAKSDGATDDLIKELQKANLPADFAYLMKMSSSYDLAMAGADYTGSLTNAAESIKSGIILTETQNTLNYKNLKPFFYNYLGSTIYDTASEDLQNYAAQVVHKNTYASLAALKLAVETAIANPPANQGGGQSSFGGSASGSPVQSGSVSTGTPSAPGTGGYNPNAAQTPFNDINSSHWAYDYVINMNQRGIMTGYNGKCRPDDSITRAEYIKIISLGFGISGTYTDVFGDVGENDWFAPYVGGAYAAGIAQGSGTYFNPNDCISREDAAVMLWRLLKSRGFAPTGNKLSFDDTNFSDYSRESVAELASYGIIDGMTERAFGPKSDITRAQAAKIIYLAINMGGDK